MEPVLPIRIMIVSGEASGDHHGASLVQALQQLHPHRRIEFFGSGGTEMRSAGVEIIADIASFTIIGAEEFVTGFRRVWQAFRTLRQAALERRPDLVVFIDYPDFNMRLAKSLKRHGLRSIYYITPQVWAWRRYRIRALRRNFERLLIILPFEQAFYQQAGVPSEFVGHPLLDMIQPPTTREVFCQSYGLAPDREIIALLPGSRRKEIHFNLPPILEAVERLAERNFQFVLPRASSVSTRLLKGVVTQFGGTMEEVPGTAGQTSLITLPQGGRITVIAGDAQQAVRHAVLAVTASGTAVLETAIIGTPMIVVYRVSALNWRLFRWMINLSHFGLVNLIAGREVAPELIQKNFTGNRLSDLIIELVKDPVRLEAIREELREVRGKLEGGASERAARAISETLGIEAEWPEEECASPTLSVQG